VNSDLLHGFYLRDFLVDPVNGQVAGPHGTMHLQSKAMEALLLLASNTGKLVTRQSLMDKVSDTISAPFPPPQTGSKRLSSPLTIRARIPVYCAYARREQ